MTFWVWLNAAPWRWRVGHFLIAAGLEYLHIGLGVWTYAIHEGTQLKDGKPFREHLYDFLPSLPAAVIVFLFRHGI